MKPWLHLPDDQLIVQTQKGHSEAYGELMRRYQTIVFNIAFRLTGERDEAADLSQEAFLRAYRALASFDLTRPFGPWIKRIVTNLALNKIQQRQPTYSLEQERLNDRGESETLDLPDVSGEPEQLYLMVEKQTLIKQALLELPGHYRIVIELRHYQELSYEEIAEVLIIPLSDVKSNLFRARRLLRKWLEEKI